MQSGPHLLLLLQPHVDRSGADAGGEAIVHAVAVPYNATTAVAAATVRGGYIHTHYVNACTARQAVPNSHGLVDAARTVPEHVKSPHGGSGPPMGRPAR